MKSTTEANETKTQRFLIKGYIFRPMVAHRLTRSLKFAAIVESVNHEAAMQQFQSSHSSNYRVKSVTKTKFLVVDSNGKKIA